MKNLVHGYELLDGGLKNYTVQKIFMTYKCLEITVKSEDGIKTIKLKFDGVEYIVLGKYNVNSVIPEINLKKTDDDMLLAEIENADDISMKIMAKKLVVTKI
ncbi:MAG: hypothetical protein J6Y29_02860 [Clostridiales bacterium]|nr:hypothetical protein [Clostridiales bacterium]